MKSSTKTLIEAMQILASEIQSDDGVANAAILEASERLREQDNRITELETQLKTAKADGVREVAKQMNTIYASEHNQKKVPPGQFGRLYERLRRLAQ